MLLWYKTLAVSLIGYEIMNRSKIAVAVFAIFAVSSPVFGTEVPEKSPDPKISQSQWQTMSLAAKQEVVLNLQLKLKAEADADAKAVSASAAKGVGSGVGSVTVGDKVYESHKLPVNGAMLQLPPNIQPMGNLVVVTTLCGGKVDIEEARRLQAVSNVAMGLWTTTRDNGSESRTKATSNKLTPTEWEEVGFERDEQGREVLVMTREMQGYQYVITGYIVGSSASSGAAANGRDVAGSLAGTGGIQSFGNNILEFSCGYTQTVRLLEKLPPAHDVPPPPPPAPKSEPAKVELEAEAHVPSVAFVPPQDKKLDPKGLTCAVFLIDGQRVVISRTQAQKDANVLCPAVTATGLMKAIMDGTYARAGYQVTTSRETRRSAVEARPGQPSQRVTDTLEWRVVK